ncbi:MAG: NFACT family protein [Lachnospiraceae bacterium]|nr:NFACT family protein [Lachnospiraceae bacterium]
MAFDGLTIAALVSEFNTYLTDGRIVKIGQPEADELMITVKKNMDGGNVQSRLVLSASGGLPLAYLTDKNKENPMTAPGFCMLLRKHIGSGRIKAVTQPGFERIIDFTIEHLDELGDLREKHLIAELMGKHSNIIFTDEGGMILDSIKHVSHLISSVREVLPGRQYETPPTQDKISPLDVERAEFFNRVFSKPFPCAKAIYTALTGISPVIAEEIVYRAGIDMERSASELEDEDRELIYASFLKLMFAVETGGYDPCIVYENNEPAEYAAVPLISYGENSKSYERMSLVIQDYYREKNVSSRMKQRSAELRKLVSNLVDRTAKKLDVQNKELKGTEKRDKYRVYGELLTTYGYSVPAGASETEVENYYDEGKLIKIPLDNTLSAMDNAKKYFARYNKLKRTYEAASVLVEETAAELDYLRSVRTSLDFVQSEGDIDEIREELSANGYAKARTGKKVRREKSVPLHYISSDGFDIYVGKNNIQNEELSMKQAQGNDLWFHAKQMPGSHVILKTTGKTDIPDRAYEEAARLAAYYSSGRQAPKVEVDYTEKRNLKKPPHSHPGYVIYHTNYSMTIEPDIRGINQA